MRRPRSWIIVAMALVVAACGTAGDQESTTPSSTTSSSIPGTVSTAPPESTTTTGASTPDSTTLPGEPAEFGPAQGATVAVIGVAYDDVLNLRAAPGADQDIIDGIPPLYDALTALGNTRQLTSTAWTEVEYQGVTGWVSLAYVGYVDGTSDETAAVVEDLGEMPSAGTMLELGRIVARSLASEEPESDLVVTVAPTLGDLGEVTYDVIGLGDDAIRGLRVHVFGQPSGGSFTLKSVEVTALCGRGLTSDGLCP